jgi:hypothetical protein
MLTRILAVTLAADRLLSPPPHAQTALARRGATKVISKWRLESGSRSKAGSRSSRGPAHCDGP